MSAESLLGYIFTATYAILLATLLISAFMIRKQLAQHAIKNSGRVPAAVALLTIIFFLAFSVLFVHPVEQLYFDENIYQGIALNIMHSGSALWCQYGTALAANCPLMQLYHDPVEISFYLALAFFAFGVGIHTAFMMELAVGAISILLVFLLASMLFGGEVGMASAVVFALIPEIFIWSRTQAVPNLYMMMFAVLAFFAFESYRKIRTLPAFSFFASALLIATLMRIEAIILLPIFLLLLAYDSVILRGIKRTLGAIAGINLKTIAVLAFFLFLLLPQIYYILYELKSPDYGTGFLCGKNSTSILSISNFMCNSVPNLQFFEGAFTRPMFYPTYFSVFTSVIALIGAVAMLWKGGQRRMPILTLGLWIAAFFAFYTAFYAGSVLYGVDVRFMLILYPPIAILSGFGIYWISNAASYKLSAQKKGRRRRKSQEIRRHIIQTLIFIVLIFLFAMLPFYNSVRVISMNTSMMPQEGMPLSATDFIYSNAYKVPSSCLVFSFTPDIWFELNRSSSQIGWFNVNNATLEKFESKYSCVVLDYGYWCSTPGYQNSTCKSDLNAYNTTLIATSRSPDPNFNYSLYYVNGYKT